jgi:sulfur-oxidizing protein SoxY
MNLSRSILRNAMLIVLPIVAYSSMAADSATSTSQSAWDYLRPQFYAQRDIGEVDEKLMRLEAPLTTPDPAATPISLHLGPDAAGKIKQIRFVIDHNPSPLAATMNLEIGTPIDEIDLRVRIDRATSVRAIAEFNDGRLEMRSVWVVASGGCSSPPSAASGGALGDIRFRPSSDDTAMQMSIRHPNHSGFQIDPVSGDPIPPHYVYHVRVSSDGKTLIDADTGISLSENPTFRIASEKAFNAPLKLEAVDTHNEHFSATWSAAPAKSAGGR